MSYFTSGHRGRGRRGDLLKVAYTDTEGAIEILPINGVSVLRGIKRDLTV